MISKYISEIFKSVNSTACCVWIPFADIHVEIQQTKHLQCTGFMFEIHFKTG